MFILCEAVSEISYDLGSPFLRHLFLDMMIWNSESYVWSKHEVMACRFCAWCLFISIDINLDKHNFYHNNSVHLDLTNHCWSHPLPAAYWLPSSFHQLAHINSNLWSICLVQKSVTVSFFGLNLCKCLLVLYTTLSPPLLTSTQPLKNTYKTLHVT